MMCMLFESVISQPGGIDKTMDKPVWKTFLSQSFIFAYLWSVGGNLIDISREKFEIYVKDQFDDFPDARFFLPLYF